MDFAVELERRFSDIYSSLYRGLFLSGTLTYDSPGQMTHNRSLRKAAESLIALMNPWSHYPVSETPILPPWTANSGPPKFAD